MKKTIVALIALVAFAGTAFAAGTETIKLPASFGEVTFEHAKHQERLKECTTCHADAKGGKIPGFSTNVVKDDAHKVCKSCHDKKEKPTGCKGCHTGPKKDK
jgi:hypothetical protein